MDGDFHGVPLDWRGRSPEPERVCKVGLRTNLYDEKFLFLCLQPYLDAINAETSSVTVKHLSSRTVEDIPLPLPPLNEQSRIVAKLEELLSELYNALESLSTAREQLTVYRQTVLKHAFEGKLTAHWRDAHKNKLESAEQILARLKKEREASYQQQLEGWENSFREWKAKGEPDRKPPRPRKPESIRPCADESLPTLPEGWLWLRLGDICSHVRNGISQKPEGNTGAKIFRISAVRPMEFALSDFRRIDNADGRYDDYFLQTGDLVFTRYNGSRAYVGVCAEYRSDGTHLFPDKLIQTKIAVPSILPGYIEKAVNCGASRRFVEKRIRTSPAGQSGVSGSDIKAIPVPICSQAEQIAISGRLWKRCPASEV